MMSKYERIPKHLRVVHEPQPVPYDPDGINEIHRGIHDFLEMFDGMDPTAAYTFGKSMNGFVEVNFGESSIPEDWDLTCKTVKEADKPLPKRTNSRTGEGKFANRRIAIAPRRVVW